MDLFNRWQKIYDDAVAELLATEDVSAFDLSNYGKLVEEYGKILKHYRHYRELTDKPVNRTDKPEILNSSHFDVLTGIFNRGYLNHNIDRIMSSMEQSGEPLSIMLADIDYFKQYNDRYGRDAGDNCLRYIAETLKSSLYRGNDFVARFGGEEFIAVLPSTNEEGARLVAERMINQIKGLEIPHESSPVSKVITVSIGVVTSANCKIAADCFFKRVDEALYQAKDHGRNQYAYLGLHL